MSGKSDLFTAWMMKVAVEEIYPRVTSPQQFEELFEVRMETEC